MTLVLNPGLLGALDKIEKANVLSESEIADLRTLVRDCHELDSFYGVDVHQLAEEKRKAAKAKLVETIEDSLHLFSARTIANGLNDVKRLVKQRRLARDRKAPNLLFYEIAYMVATREARHSAIKAAIAEYADHVGRDFDSVSAQFYREKAKVKKRHNTLSYSVTSNPKGKKTK